MERCTRQWLAICLILLASTRIYSAAWDPSFGDHGITIFRFGANPNPATSQQMGNDGFAFGGLLNNGGGTSNVGLLAKVRADGSIDSNFGTGGISQINAINQIYSLGVDSSGGLLAGGAEGLVRVLPSGAPDPTFGNAGIATTSLPTALFPYDITTRSSDGQIITVGGAGSGDIAAAGFTPSGQRVWARQETLSSVFHQDRALAVLVQHDGKVLAAGSKYELYMCCPGQQTFQGHVLVRYNIDGTPDASFATSGRLIYNITGGLGRTNSLRKLNVLPDGKIQMVAIDYDQLLIARFTPNGAFDQTFGNLGVVSQPLSIRGYQDVKFLPNGNIRLAGALGGFVYERVFDSLGNQLLSQKIEVPKPSGVGGNIVDLAGGRILDDGDLLVFGQTWDPATPDARDLVVGRIDSNFSAVPEPSSLVLAGMAIIAVSFGRFSARAHRPAHR